MQPTNTLRLPPVALTLACALVAHAALWPFRANDVDEYLIPWLEHIRHTGMIGAFATPFSNYTPPYLYLLAFASPLAAIFPLVTVIKLLSTAGSIALALAVWRLLRALDCAQPARGAALVLALPSTLLNAPFLAQCDAVWAAACIMAVAMAIERRHAPMLAWFGLAIAIKLQAAFLGPFVVALLINRRVSTRLWLIAPLVVLLTLVPAWAVGWPFGDLVTIYFRQAAYSDVLSLNAPNAWIIIQTLPLIGDLPLKAMAMAIATGASASYIAWLASHRLPARVIPAAALLAVLLVVGVLPHMHERYFFLCDILALSVALTRRDRTGWFIAVAVQAGSTLAILAYILDTQALAVLGAVSMMIATYQVALLLGFPSRADLSAKDDAGSTPTCAIIAWPRPMNARHRPS
ncbi:Gpi18-like mannosyltransferase [Sphingomonas sp. PP-F2F-A104-K0414]|uniref:hypothetical protein n=1 Tax=Sphingomonas sp. PP-F2F-A104-K0414 TaxID=2135661 RepID=UPI00104A6571|nr:hypothetical protein [Sphingomonas sp. PP-F2F-A104-K0414]TCP97053.1 Gpi18-like mannosyltransferase [Sphingomonas sp. PP-F2F-A104-K0414]